MIIYRGNFRDILEGVFNTINIFDLTKLFHNVVKTLIDGFIGERAMYVHCNFG